MAADVYSLGMTVLHMATRRLPVSSQADETLEEFEQGTADLWDGQVRACMSFDGVYLSLKPKRPGASLPCLRACLPNRVVPVQPMPALFACVRRVL